MGKSDGRGAGPDGRQHEGPPARTPAGLDVTHITVDDDAARARSTLPPTLIAALDADRPRTPPLCVDLAEVDEIVLGRGERGVAREDERGLRRLVVRMADRRMSSVHARIRRADGRYQLEDAGSRNGTRLNGEPCTTAPLASGDRLQVGHTFLVFRDAASTPTAVPGTPPWMVRGAPLLTTCSRELARALTALVAVAPRDVSVILQGESGTGKEVVARALHDCSGRPGELVAVNCGALPAALVEGELFGHRKGAFSGATEDRAGLVRAADRGTLFLDEIGDLPLPAQRTLLRVLQEREVTPLGAARPIEVDLRVVSASHHDLVAMVAAGTLRGDLYARLSGITVRLPPLRERVEDLGLILGTLLDRLVPDLADSVSLRPEAARALFHHTWPLNVRELEKCVGAAIAIAAAEPRAAGAPIVVTEQHLALAPVAGATPAPVASEPARPAVPRGNLDDEIRALERARMTEALAATGGNQSRAAELIGMPRRTFVAKLKEYGLGTARSQPSDD